MKILWQDKLLGEVLRLEYGKPLEDADRNPDGLYPVYGANGEKSRSDKFYFGKSSIIVGRKGSAGEVNFTEEKFWPLDVTYFVTFDERQYHLEFLYYLLNTLNLPSLAKGVKPGINRAEVYSKAVKIPPVREQRRIARILAEAFEGIANAEANAERSIQNANSLARSLINSGITGELTHDWRRKHQDEKAAAVTLKNALTARYKKANRADDSLDLHLPVSIKPIEIPGNWTLASPAQLSTHIVDCPHSTPKWTPEGVICLRTTNFKPGHLDLEYPQFVSEETYKQRIARLEPQSGDVLYSREGGILGIACAIPEGLRVCLGQRMMQFRLDRTIILPEFFTAVLNSTLILSEVKRLTGGAASPHLNIRDIRTFPIPLPPVAEQKVIAQKLKGVAVETQRLASIYQEKLTALDALKKSLLQQAFTGNL